MSFITPNTFIIAEIGTSHNGSLDKAKQLIDASIEAGADCIKFQIVYANEILHPDTGFVKLPTGNIPLYQRFKELEVSPSFYEKCASYCNDNKVLFSASPFGLKSLHELVELKPAAVKIASPELNHFPLLNETANIASDIPCILSSGVSRIGDIEKALDAVENIKQKALLHCITSYPAPETEYNLKVLETLSAAFGITMGVSDHSLDPVLVPVLSVACGGKIIEKHICLSKEGIGLDDPVALPPEDFAKMVQTVRKMEKLSKQEIIEQISKEYGTEKINQILGNGRKVLAASEKNNYTRTNRSIHFMKDMKKGEIITKEDISILRTEKILTPGISPEFITQVTGAALKENVKSGEGLTWKHVL